MNCNHIFAIFPYLKTVADVQVRGLRWRSSRSGNDVPLDLQRSLSTILDMFFLQDEVQLQDMLYACYPLPASKEDEHRLSRLLRETQLLISYIYCVPHRSGGVFLPAESCTMFTFSPGDSMAWPGLVPTSLVWIDNYNDDRVRRIDGRTLPKDDMIPGFAVQRNTDVRFWAAEGTRIFPELPLIPLNYSQELSGNLYTFLSHSRNWAFANLFASTCDFEVTETHERVFVSLEWYLRRCRRAASRSESLISLSIALESLLRVRSGKELTERFKDAVVTLLGPVPRLDSWLDQFYTARSKAVHEGLPHNLMFYAVDRDSLKKPHHPTRAWCNTAH